MRNRKVILLLLTAVLAFAAADFALYFGDADAKVVERTSLVDISAGVSRIAVERKNTPVTVLEKTADRWKIVSPFSGVVEEQAVMKLLDAVSLTPISDAMSDSELLKLGRTRADFSLDDPVVSVTLTDPAGKTETIGFGAPTPSADGVYAMVAGSAALFVVPLSVMEAVDVTADGFRRRSLFTSGFESVAAFGIKRGTGSILEFEREGDGWKMRDGAASPQKVSKFISDLTSAAAVNFVWPVGSSNETEHASNSLLAGYGLDPDGALTVTFKGADGADGRISFGKAAGDGLVYALVQNGGAVVTVPAALKDAAGQDAVMFTDSRVFPVEARSVVFFSVSDNGILYALSRDKSGSWGIESPISAPADQTAAGALLSRLLSLSPADIVPSGGVAVSITTNEAKVTVSRESVFGNLPPEGLRSLEMLRVDPALVRRIVRIPQDKTVKPVSVVYGRDRRAWNVESGDNVATVRENGVKTVLSALNPLSALKVEKLRVQASELSAYGLDAPFLTVAVDQESDESVRRNIIIGKKTAGGRFATIGSSDAVFVISDAAVRALASEITGK
ncbi:MAG: DUF4340 domain-containing protein [Kiritimatiellae bacterium]|nr:DUF4340 domain-containing protein [Kiritimatiellia bacterium]